MTGLLLLTLRELRARKVVMGLFVVATAVWLAFALALQLDVVDGSLAGVRIFGNETSIAESGPVLDPQTGQPVLDPETGQPAEVRNPLGANPLESLVFGAQAFVAGAAYWVGILLCLYATGGLVASLVEPGQADLLVSKPLSRSAVLAGRLGGVGAVTFALVAYLLGRGVARDVAQDGHLEPAFPARHRRRVGHVRGPLRRRDARERVERLGRARGSSRRSGWSWSRSCSPSRTSR